MDRRTAQSRIFSSGENLAQSSRSNDITRRSFFRMGVGAATLAAASLVHPTTQAEADEATDVRLIIGSDVHVPQYSSLQKLPPIFTWMASMAPTKICLVGDIVDSGVQSYYDQFNQVLAASPFASSIQDSFVFCQGNHETYSVGVSGAPALFKQNLGQEPNKVVWAGSVPIVTMGPNTNSDSYYAANLAFLQEALAGIAADERYSASRPIMVLCHHAIPNTVYASPEWHGTYGDQVIAELKKYPNVIHVSGHSHSTLEDARSIDQSLGFTCIQDATLSAYFENEKAKPFAMYDPTTGAATSYPQIGSDFGKAAQCVVLDIKASGATVVSRYDLIGLVGGGQARKLYEDWTVDIPSLASGAIAYPQARTSNPPLAPSDGSVTVTDTGSGTIKVDFPAFEAASDNNNDMIHDYKVVAQPVANDGSAAGDPAVRRYFADYFLPAAERGTAWSVVVAGLSSGLSYSVRVSAETSFATADETSGVSKALAAATSVGTEAPAMLLDIDYRRGNPADAMGHELYKAGGSLAADQTLVDGVTSSVYESDGTGGYGYTLSAAEHQLISNGSTTECLFKMVDIQSDQCVFSNQQSAGAGFEVENGNLEFWLNPASGRRVIPKGAIAAGEWVHAIATHDGSTVTLYINGQQVATAAAQGVKVPTPKRYYVGSDCRTSDEPEIACAAGTRIAYARIYTRAFSADEVATAYANARTEPEQLLLDIDFAKGSTDDTKGHASKLWDTSALGSQALLNGATGTVLTVAGKGGLSYRLGDGDFALLAQGSSIECAFKAPSVSGDWCPFSCQQSAGMGLEVTSGELYFYLRVLGNSGDRYETVSTPVSAGEWIHAVGTYDGKTLRLYVNGKLAGELGAEGTMKVPTPHLFFVGADTDSSEQPQYLAPAGTQIQAARLYTRPISDDEVATRFAALATAAEEPDQKPDDPNSEQKPDDPGAGTDDPGAGTDDPGANDKPEDGGNTGNTGDTGDAGNSGNTGDPAVGGDASNTGNTGNTGRTDDADNTGNVVPTGNVGATSGTVLAGAAPKASSASVPAATVPNTGDALPQGIAAMLALIGGAGALLGGRALTADSATSDEGDAE